MLSLRNERVVNGFVLRFDFLIDYSHAPYSQAARVSVFILPSSVITFCIGQTIRFLL